MLPLMLSSSTLSQPSPKAESRLNFYPLAEYRIMVYRSKSFSSRVWRRSDVWLNHKPFGVKMMSSGGRLYMEASGLALSLSLLSQDL